MIESFSAERRSPAVIIRDIWINLERRFAGADRISQALLKRVSNLTCATSSHDRQRICSILDLARQVQSLIADCPELKLFDQQVGLVRFLNKLPIDFQTRWKAIRSQFKASQGFHPPFDVFLDTLSSYTTIAVEPDFDEGEPRSKNARVLSSSCEPITHRQGSQYPTKPVDPRFSIPSSKPNAGKSVRPRCLFHKTTGHSILECKACSHLKPEDKKRFVFEHKLCYVCLGDHFENRCPSRQNVRCDVCQQNHCTAMHLGRPLARDVPTPTVVHEINNACTTLCGSDVFTPVCSKTLQVQLKLKGSEKVLNCLCVIDEQSNASFCHDDILAYFDVPPSETVRYKLRTLSTTTETSGFLVPDLMIRGRNQSN